MIDNKLWETEEEEFNALSVLSNISRYNTRYRIKNESVAAHTFYTIWFTANICSKLELSPRVTYLAMEAAMVHDIPEIYINDITYDCKKLIPELGALIAPFEETIVRKLSKGSANILFDPSNVEEKLINLIVRYADVVSVKQYALSEIKLGNTSFKDILEGAEDRVEELSKDLIRVLGEYRRN